MKYIIDVDRMKSKALMISYIQRFSDSYSHSEMCFGKAISIT
jgi:hypothetical protein